MNSKEYVRTDFFKKYNECSVLSLSGKHSSAEVTQECLRIGKLVEKDMKDIDKTLLDGVMATNNRLSLTLEKPENNDFTGQYILSKKIRDAKDAESISWKPFEDANQIYLSQIGYVRISREDKPPVEASPIMIIFVMIASLFLVMKDKPKKKKEIKE